MTAESLESSAWSVTSRPRPAAPATRRISLRRHLPALALLAMLLLLSLIVVATMPAHAKDFSPPPAALVTTVALALLALLIGGAVSVSRTLSDALVSIAAAVGALGLGQTVAPIASRITEVAAIDTALRDAAASLAARERQLARRERRLLRAEQVAGIGSAVHDAAADEARWSDELYRILALDPRTTAPGSERFLESVHEDDRDRMSAARSDERPSDEPAITEFRIVRPSGEVRWLHGSIDVERDEEGRIRRFSAICRDITPQHEAERRERELERQLLHAQRLDALGTLAGGIAHDLNNTLVPVLGLTKLTMRRVPKESREYSNLGTILQAGERARDLVRQILAFTRKEEPARQIVDLASMVRDSLKMLCASLPSTIHIEELIEEVPLVSANPAQLHQVMINLVVNAAQAIGDQMGTITVRLVAETPDTARRTPPTIHLAISDTGCGMDEAVARRIFEPFFTTKNVGEGTGLGLSVVHGIIAQHGGRIGVESRVGHGTRFDVYLPGLSEEEANERLEAARVAL
jgi:signal transduction histidine kinase